MNRSRFWMLCLTLIGLSLFLTGEVYAFWAQVNEDGFGRLRNNSTWAMVVFNNELFVGTGQPGRIYRSNGIPSSVTDRFQWTIVSLPRHIEGVLTDYEVDDVFDLEVLETPTGSWLYAATSGTDQGSDGSIKTNIVLRSSDGIGWEAVGNIWRTAFTGETVAMEVFDGHLYTSMGDKERLLLDESIEVMRDVMRLMRTDGAAWELVVQASEGDIELGVGDSHFGKLKVFNGHLYAGTAGINELEGGDRTAEVWRTVNGREWEKVAELSSATVAEVESMEVFNEYLYVGTKNHPLSDEESVGPELWRTNDGTEWEQVPLNGQFNIERLHVDSLCAYEGHLYAGISGGYLNAPFAMVYRSADGLTWEDVTPNALAQDETNRLIGAMSVASGTLLVGTGLNGASGTEIWQYDPDRMSVLPAGIMKQPERIPDSSDLGPKTLSLVDCQPGPMFFGTFCDPRVNPEQDRFLIVDLDDDYAELFSKKELGLSPDDGPLFAAAPVKWGGKSVFVVSVPFADSKKTDTGAIIFFDRDGTVIARFEGRNRGERLGLDMDVRGDEVIVVSSKRVLGIRDGKVIQEISIAAKLRPDLGVRTAFTDDVDGDKRPDVLLGTPYASSGGLAEAGMIQVISSKNGAIIDTLYGRYPGQRMGAVLHPISQARASAGK